VEIPISMLEELRTKFCSRDDNKGESFWLVLSMGNIGKVNCLGSLKSLLFVRVGLVKQGLVFW